MMKGHVALGRGATIASAVSLCYNTSASPQTIRLAVRARIQDAGFLTICRSNEIAIGSQLL